MSPDTVHALLTAALGLVMTALGLLILRDPHRLPELPETPEELE